MNGARWALRVGPITAGFIAADSMDVYFGTEPSWTFVHRRVLMAAGVGSGVGWAALVMRQSIVAKRMSKGLHMKSP